MAIFTLCISCKHYHPYNDNDFTEGECIKSDTDYEHEWVSADYSCKDFIPLGGEIDD